MSRPTEQRLLEQAYRVYNRRYFGGRLPRARVEWARRMKPGYYGLALWKYTRRGLLPGSAVILLATWMWRYPEVWRQTLLHEMCHVGSRDAGHGARFFRELRRVLRAGAFDRLV